MPRPKGVMMAGTPAFSENPPPVGECAIPRFDARAFAGVDEAMRAAFVRDGALVLENMVTAEACEALRARMMEMVEGFDAQGHRAIFSTTDRMKDNSESLFASAGEVHFFFEAEALDADGNLIVDKAAALNKVGHALHDRDPVFAAFSRQPRFRALVFGLGLAEPLLIQSMYIFKPPRIGGEVICHQDATYLWTEPQSVIGIWVALEDATTHNGCLWGIPGAHCEPSPRQRMRRAAGGGVEFVTLDSQPWSVSQTMPLEAAKGTAIVLDGRFPHLSGPNRSAVSRHAYALHVIDGACHYPTDNWLRRAADDPLRGF
jgi:phytanoyl-CoA hydroxylase